MKNSYRFLILILIVATAATLLSVFGKGVSFADGEIKEVEADIVAPSTYLEYYKLNAPVDVAIRDDMFLIAEMGRLIKYADGVFTEYDLDGYSVSKIALYADFCLFLSVSRLYYIDLNTGAVEETDVNVSNYFFVYGNTLVTNPTSSVFRYTLSVDDAGKLNFGAKTTYTDLDGEARKITVIGKESIYYFNEGKLYPFDFASGTGLKLAENVGDIRYTATDGESIFYTTATGVYKIDMYTREVITIMTVKTQEKLFNLLNPQGIFAYNGSLYVADATMNAVYQIDLTTNSTTDFAVTDRGDSANRIETAFDIAYDETTVYALEATAIKAYDHKTGDHYSYSLAGFPGAKMIAATGGYLFLSDSSNPFVVKSENGTLKSVPIASDVSDYKNITDVNARENCFYFINNESINSTMTACVYKLDLATMTISIVTRITGTGKKITSDIFGTLYVAVYDGENYDYYSFNPLSPDDKKVLLSGETAPLSIFVDIQSNFFILYDNEVIDGFIEVDGAYVKNATYHISLSQNLPEHTFIKDACLIDGTNDVYLLTECCLLTAKKDSALCSDVVGLKQLAVPDDYRIETDDSPLFASVKKGAKLFEVELPLIDESGTTDEEFFLSTAYTSETKDDKYVVIIDTARYYLLVNMNVCALVRHEDAEVYAPVKTPTEERYFIVDDFGIYGHPLTDKYFKSGTVCVNDSVTTVFTLTLNGVEYAFIRSGDMVGYVPCSLLKKSVSADNTPSTYYTAKIAKGGATVYAEADLISEIGRLDGEADVYALEKLDGVTKIVFDGGVGYVSSDKIVPSTYYAVRNIIVVCALFLGLFATMAYIMITKVFRKDEKK